MAEEELDAGIFTADIDEGEKPEADVVEEKPKEEPAEEPTEDPEEEKEEEDEKPDKIAELEAKLEESRKEINRLGYALRKGEKKETKDEPVFTKAQLLALYKEHADNPEVQFQIIEEMSRQGKVDAQASAEKSAEIKTKKTQMDQFLEQAYPDVRQEGSEIHQNVQKAIEYLGLDGNPYAEFLGFSAMMLHNLPKAIEQIKEQAKAEVLKTSEEDLAKKAEEARKKNIDATKPAKARTGFEDKTASLSAEQLETAKRLGIATKAQLAKYAKFLGAKSGVVQAEA